MFYEIYLNNEDLELCLETATFELDYSPAIGELIFIDPRSKHITNFQCCDSSKLPYIHGKIFKVVSSIFNTATLSKSIKLVRNEY